MSISINRGALRRQAPPILRNAFRPFFLGGAVWAALLVPFWALEYLGLLPGLIQTGLGMNGHAHEMLFGFLAAVICGFALTAIPNWTGRAPVSGLPLALLFALWATGRFASLALTGSAATLLDLSFLLVLTGVVLREICAGRNWRNLPVAALIMGFTAAHVAYHSPGLVATATQATLAVAILLVALIGGRIVPSFTRNWLAARNAPQAELVAPPMTGYDKLSFLPLLMALASWVFAAPALLAGSFLLLAAASQAFRLSRWQGGQTLREPLIWSLHFGFAWMPVCLALLGAGLIWPTIVSQSAGVHAATAGLIGTMTLAVMTRASLGHTGRERTADTATTWIFGLAHIGAMARVLSAMIGNEPILLATSAALWSAAFGLFAIGYAPMLFCHPRRAPSGEGRAP